MSDALHEYAEAVRTGDLFVVGAVYDSRDDLGKGKGRLHVIDINGEVSPERIESAPILEAAKRLATSP